MKLVEIDPTGWGDPDMEFEEIDQVPFSEDRFLRPDADKVTCRDCCKVQYNPCSAYCKAYPEPEGKPRNILWNNAKCKYKVSINDSKKAGN